MSDWFKRNAKAIVAGLGGGLLFLQQTLAPGTLGHTAVSLALVCGVAAGVWVVPNKPPAS